MLSTRCWRLSEGLNIDSILPDDTDRVVAAEITLDGVLGEELRIQTICEIDVVEEFEKPYQNKANNIKILPEHLVALTKQ